MAEPRAIRGAGERLARLVRDEAARCGLALTVEQRRPDAAFFAVTGPNPSLALHLYAVEPRPAPDNSEEREDTRIDGEPWSVFRPAPLPADLRWALAARAADPVEEHAVLELAVRALHAPGRVVDRPVDGGDDGVDSRDGTDGGDGTDGTDAPDELELRFDDTFDLDRQALLLRSLGAPHHPLIGCVARVWLRSGRVLRRVRRVDVRTLNVRRSTDRNTERTERRP